MTDIFASEKETAALFSYTTEFFVAANDRCSRWWSSQDSSPESFFTEWPRGVGNTIANLLFFIFCSYLINNHNNNRQTHRPTHHPCEKATLFCSKLIGWPCRNFVTKHNFATDHITTHLTSQRMSVTVWYIFQ